MRIQKYQNDQVIEDYSCYNEDNMEAMMEAIIKRESIHPCLLLKGIVFPDYAYIQYDDSKHTEYIITY